jgi:hypothetical protein
MRTTPWFGLYLPVGLRADQKGRGPSFGKGGGARKLHSFGCGAGGSLDVGAPSGAPTKGSVHTTCLQAEWAGPQTGFLREPGTGPRVGDASPSGDADPTRQIRPTLLSAASFGAAREANPCCSRRPALRGRAPRT